MNKYLQIFLTVTLVVLELIALILIRRWASSSVTFDSEAVVAVGTVTSAVILAVTFFIQHRFSVKREKDQREYLGEREEQQREYLEKRDREQSERWSCERADFKKKITEEAATNESNIAFDTYLRLLQQIENVITKTSVPLEERLLEIGMLTSSIVMIEPYLTNPLHKVVIRSRHGVFSVSLSPLLKELEVTTDNLYFEDMRGVLFLALSNYSVLFEGPLGVLFTNISNGHFEKIPSTLQSRAQLFFPRTWSTFTNGCIKKRKQTS